MLASSEAIILASYTYKEEFACVEHKRICQCCLTIVCPLLHLQISLAGFLLMGCLGTKHSAQSMHKAVSGELPRVIINTAVILKLCLQFDSHVSTSLQTAVLPEAFCVACILVSNRAVLVQSYDASEGEALASKYEKLNWRIISKPGGATVKPDEFYILYG